MGINTGYILACKLHLETSCETWVRSLLKFTLLGSNKPIKQKNIDCIRLMLNIAITEGNGLNGSWRNVLECVSEFSFT
eukprot:UN03349